MFDQTKQEDDELFESSDLEDQANEDSDTTETTNVELDTELEAKESAPSEGEKKRQQMLDTYERRLASGEVTLETLPANLKWMIPELKARVKLAEKEPDIQALVDKKFAEKEDNQLFTTLKAQLNASNLSNEMKKLVTESYSAMRKGGMQNRGEALKIAMTPVMTMMEDDTAKETRRGMKIPKPGLEINHGDEPKDPTDPNFFKQSPQKRIEKLAALAGLKLPK